MSAAAERTMSQAERLDRLRADGLGLLSFLEAAAYIGPGFTKRWVEDRVYDKVDPLPSFRLGGKRTKGTPDDHQDQHREAQRIPD